jgi:hypothetical protein
METFTAEIPETFNLSSIDSRNSDGPVAGVPPYQPMGYWPPPQNSSYSFSFVPPALMPFSQDQPGHSPSTYFHTRNTNPFIFPLFSQRMNANPLPRPTQQDFTHTPESHIALVRAMNMQSSPHQTAQEQHPRHQEQQNDRPFKCDQCPQSFNRNHDIKRHKQVHLAVRPFPCGHCEKRFSRKDALKVRSASGFICNNLEAAVRIY